MVIYPLTSSVFLFFRPHWRDVCFQTGYLINGIFHQSNDSYLQSDCSSIPRGGHWFELTVEVRQNSAIVFVDGTHLTSFRTHHPLKAAGGIAVASGCRRITRFKNFEIKDLAPLPFNTSGCTSARTVGGFFTLVAGNDIIRDFLCRAFFPTSVDESTYILTVSLYSQTEPQAVNIRYGVIFNVHNGRNFEFVYFW